MHAQPAQPTPEFWTQEELTQTIVDVYRANGFEVDQSRPLTFPLSFMSTQPGAPHIPIAVGAFAVQPGENLSAQHVQAFWELVASAGAQSGVLVTNSFFDGSALEMATAVPVLMIDRNGLLEAIQGAQGQLANQSTQIPPNQPSQSQVPPQKQDLGAQAVQNSESAAKTPDTANDLSHPVAAGIAKAIALRGRPIKVEPEAASSLQPGQSHSNVSERTPLSNPSSSPSATNENKAPLPPSGSFFEETEPEKSPQPKSKATAKLTSQPKSQSESSEELAPPKAPVAKSGKTARVRWKSNARRSRGHSGLTTFGIAAMFLASLLAVGWRFFPKERNQLVDWLQINVVSPVLNPVDGQSTSNKDETEEGTTIPQKISVGAKEESTAELQRQLVYRVELLEELKERVQAEQLASEVFMRGRFPKKAGLDFVELGANELVETVRLICENDDDSPKLTPLEQTRVLPYLGIAAGELEHISPPIDIDALLVADNDSQYANPFDSARALNTLERRLWVETAIDSRRHAQSIAAVAGAARASGIDFVAQNDSDLDAVIAAITTGKTIDDPKSPFHGHTFKSPPPPADKFGEVRQFLKVANGRIRYHEELPANLPGELRFQSSDNPASLKQALEVAEQLIRSTATQILVNKANRDKALMPVKGRS